MIYLVLVVDRLFFWGVPGLRQEVQHDLFAVRLKYKKGGRFI